jgi:hypothetical protein
MMARLKLLPDATFPLIPVTESLRSATAIDAEEQSYRNCVLFLIISETVQKPGVEGSEALPGSKGGEMLDQYSRD